MAAPRQTHGWGGGLAVVAGKRKERNALTRNERDGRRAAPSRDKERDDGGSEAGWCPPQENPRSVTQSQAGDPRRVDGVPRGIRTPVPAVKGRCPGPG